MKDLTQQYVEQLENMVKDLREKKLELEEENKKLKELQICGKTVAERIEEDKKVVRMDTSCIEEDTLQELKDLGKI